MSARAGSKRLPGACQCHYGAGPVTRELPQHCLTRSKVRCRFCDTDQMGVVHHQNFIAYFELARIEYLRNRGLNYSSWIALGIHLPVIEVNVRYRKAAYLDDLLTVESRLTQLGRVKVRFDYRVFRDTDDHTEFIAEGYTLLACVGNDHLPMRIPREAEVVLLSKEMKASEVHA